MGTSSLQRPRGLPDSGSRGPAAGWRPGCRRNPEPQALAGKVLALLFLSPSLRTLSSFQAAMVRLGGGSFVISPDMSIHGLETRSGIVMDGVAAEHLREAIPVISSYGDALGIRAFANRVKLEDDLADTEFAAMRALVKMPLINMESAIQHPCQSLADWKTWTSSVCPRKGGKFVLSWAWHPEGAAAGGALRDTAHGGDARHGRHRGAARRLRAAAADHGQGAAGGRSVGRLRARDQQIARRRSKAPT